MAEKICDLIKSGGMKGIDYSNPITISTSGQTAPASGLLVIQANATAGYVGIKVNSNQVTSIETFGRYGAYVNCIVSQGDSITFDVYVTSIASAKIYPFK